LQIGQGAGSTSEAGLPMVSALIVVAEPLRRRRARAQALPDLTTSQDAVHRPGHGAIIALVSCATIAQARMCNWGLPLRSPHGLRQLLLRDDPFGAAGSAPHSTPRAAVAVYGQITQVSENGARQVCLGRLTRHIKVTETRLRLRTRESHVQILAAPPERHPRGCPSCVQGADCRIGPRDH
jgi:hypothetical protein